MLEPTRVKLLHKINEHGSTESIPVWLTQVDLAQNAQLATACSKYNLCIQGYLQHYVLQGGPRSCCLALELKSLRASTCL